MRVLLTVIVLLAVSGCATNPSMRAGVLHDQALATGDRSAVEVRRIASDAAMAACLRSNGRRLCVDGDCQCIGIQEMRREMRQILQPDPVLHF